jgi:hypothetical protein
MKSPVVASRQSWFARNRMALLTVAIVAVYALFIEWFWGWSSILASGRGRCVADCCSACPSDQHLFLADLAHL